MIRAAPVYLDLISFPKIPSCTNHSYLRVLKVIVIKVICISKDILEHGFLLIKKNLWILKHDDIDVSRKI